MNAILICLQGLFSKKIRLRRLKKEACYTLRMTRSAIFIICLQGLLFKKFRLRQFKMEASYTLRITLSTILICLQGLFFKKNCLRQFKKEAIYTLKMTQCHIKIKCFVSSVEPECIMLCCYANKLVKTMIINLRM